MEYIGLIGIDFTIKCITALTSSAASIYTLSSSISNNQNTNIMYFLKELDISENVQIVENLLLEINIKNNHSQTLASAIKSLKDCVIEIEQILIEMQSRMSYNNSLWILKTFRSYGFNDIIEKLKILNNILNKRKNLLFEVIKISEHLNKNKNIDMIGSITIIN